jgi:hypothetical protein
LGYVSVSMSRDFSRPAVLVNVVLASVVSFPHDIEVVRQAALLRAKLIGGERAAGHLRVVQASFAKEIAEFVRSRYTVWWAKGRAGSCRWNASNCRALVLRLQMP